MPLSYYTIEENSKIHRKSRYSDRGEALRDLSKNYLHISNQTISVRGTLSLCSDKSLNVH